MDKSSDGVTCTINGGWRHDLRKKEASFMLGVKNWNHLDQHDTRVEEGTEPQSHAIAHGVIENKVGANGCSMWLHGK